MNTSPHVRRAGRRLACGALLFAVLSGCGTGPVPPQTAEADGGPVAEASDAGTPGSTIGGPSEAAAGGMADKNAADRATQAPGAAPEQTRPRPKPTRPPHNNGVVRISFASRCVAPGHVLAIRIQAPRRAFLSMILRWPAEGGLKSNVGDATDTGDYLWNLTVPQSITGEGLVYVSSTGADGQRHGSATADATFEVRPLGLC